MKIKWSMTGFLLFLMLGVATAQQPQFSSLDSLEDRAAKGDAKSQCAVAEKYDPGISGSGDIASKDLDKAIEWYLKSAKQGYAEAQCNLGFLYQREPLKNYSEALKWFRMAADQEYANAQNSIGVIYNHGFGVPKDSVEAIKWYRKAAENGDAVAQFNLGAMYYHGEGVPQNYTEAFKWYRKSAEQGNAQAQGLVGICYENGNGVTNDIVEAVKWHRKAAEQGNIRDECSLGFFYYSGKGVPKDYSEAVKWFRKAAERGDDIGEDQLGDCYYFGQGVPQNHVEAGKWYGKAAEQGNPWAQYKLGRLYYFGDGILLDYAEAVKWNALAAAQGNEDAVKMWNYVLKEKIPTDQMAEGQRRAHEFVPHIEIAGQQSSKSNISNSPTNPSFTGTGFFITDDGYLISNYHVVKGAAKVRLLTGAGLIDAKVVRVDVANDLALLKAEGKFSPLPIAASRTAHLGGTVATVGFPNIGLQGFSPKLAKGEVASLSGAADDPRYFQISVPVQPGNSGGALVDERGNVIGIVSAKLDASVALAASGALPENVNYAVKSSFLLGFLESVPAVSAKLKAPVTADRKFEDVVKSAQQAAVLVLVY